MKQKFLQTLSLLAFLLAGIFATAQAQPINGFTADIPFTFTVNNQEFSAGHYSICLRENGAVRHLRLSSADKKKTIVMFSILKEAPTYPAKSKMVFRRYGNRYFLGEIWARGESNGHEITRSEAEKQLRQQSRKELISARPTASNNVEIFVLTEPQ